MPPGIRASRTCGKICHTESYGSQQGPNPAIEKDK
eukprot:CAMPEP_0179317752 /NCGR_PEP_ID=MMETSP0797-20121207/56463_1 /TAXON_ID=47934 /ORGANISM="Dinophysis acuminata, Strain DAEP01" /LENGTH=34 /DNA_ID= /DNA_START= /DNA_END= /DNA_ORIENTATION=